MTTNLSREALAVNWSPEILDTYMSEIQKARETGQESDEAISTDSESDSDFEDGNSSTISSTSASMSNVDIERPSDIASDDSAFSSEDEFTEDDIREQQRIYRELVLGRPAPAILQLRTKDLKDMHEKYMKQLDDADEELGELMGVARNVTTRRHPDEGVITMDAVGDDDEEARVDELRKRSGKEIFETDKKTLVRQLVSLAQALFRKERKIKGLLW